MKNRRARDNAIVIEEVISSFKKISGKIGSILLKIDLEKAFDKIECSFIY